MYIILGGRPCDGWVTSIPTLVISDVSSEGKHDGDVATEQAGVREDYWRIA